MDVGHKEKKAHFVDLNEHRIEEWFHGLVIPALPKETCQKQGVTEEKISYHLSSLFILIPEA